MDYYFDLGILAGIFAGRLVKRFHKIPIIGFGIIATIVAVGFVGFLPGILALSGIIFIGFSFHLADTVIKVMLNQKIPENSRSSIFSLSSLICSLFLAGSRPFIGMISNNQSPIIAFRWWFYFGILLGVSLLFLLLDIYKKIRK
jgi:MFS family permease